MTPAEAPPGTWGYQVCAAASLVFSPMVCFSAVWSWGAQPDGGLCVAGLVQTPGGRYGQPVVKTHQGHVGMVPSAAMSAWKPGFLLVSEEHTCTCPRNNVACHLGIPCASPRQHQVLCTTLLAICLGHAAIFAKRTPCERWTSSG